MFVNKCQIPTCFYVRINVDELHESFKACDAALETFQDNFEYDHHYFPTSSTTLFLQSHCVTPFLSVLPYSRLNLVFLDDMLDVHEDNSDQLDEGDDEGAKGRSSEMITQQPPACSNHGVQTNTALVSAGWDILLEWTTML